MEHEGRKLTLFVLSARRSGGRRHWKHWRRLSALGKQAPVCPSAGPRARARGPETKPPLPISAGRQPPAASPTQPAGPKVVSGLALSHRRQTDQTNRRGPQSGRLESFWRPVCFLRPARLRWPPAPQLAAPGWPAPESAARWARRRASCRASCPQSEQSRRAGFWLIPTTAGQAFGRSVLLIYNKCVAVAIHFCPFNLLPFVVRWDGPNLGRPGLGVAGF